MYNNMLYLCIVIDVSRHRNCNYIIQTFVFSMKYLDIYHKYFQNDIYPSISC